MSGEFLMGYPRRVPLRSAARRRVRPARRRATSVVLEVFAEFGRAVEGGDPHAQDQRLVDGPVSPIHPKTPRRPKRPPTAQGGADQT
jgi:hypothetical protein